MPHSCPSRERVKPPIALPHVKKIPKPSSRSCGLWSLCSRHPPHVNKSMAGVPCSQCHRDEVMSDRASEGWQGALDGTAFRRHWAGFLHFSGELRSLGFCVKPSQMRCWPQTRINNTPVCLGDPDGPVAASVDLGCVHDARGSRWGLKSNNGVLC